MRTASRNIDGVSWHKDLKSSFNLIADGTSVGVVGASGTWKHRHQSTALGTANSTHMHLNLDDISCYARLVGHLKRDILHQSAIEKAPDSLRKEVVN